MAPPSKSSNFTARQSAQAAGYSPAVFSVAPYYDSICAFIRGKYRQQPNLQVICGDFTALEWPEASLDLFYSATAFHWIPEDIGYPKAFPFLKPGGTLAVFWNKACPDDPDKPVHQAVQAVFARYHDDHGHQATPHFSNTRFEKTLNALKKAGFLDATCTLFEGTRYFDSESYVELLNTYSENIALSSTVRRAFFADLSKAIADNGNDLIIQDRMDLYLAQKP